MSITLREVQSKSELKEFLYLPWKLYGQEKNWVPPLKLALHEMFSPKHPFYKNASIKSWIAYQNDRPVGRISAIINQAHNEFHQEKCGFFGFFDCIDSEEIAQSLFDRADSFLKEEGMELVRGPMNPSTNYECGTLVEGFDDPPQIMMTFNPPYIPGLIEKSGHAKVKDLLAYDIPVDFKMPEKIVNVAQRVERSNNITYR